VQYYNIYARNIDFKRFFLSTWRFDTHIRLNKHHLFLSVHYCFKCTIWPRNAECEMKNLSTRRDATLISKTRIVKELSPLLNKRCFKYKSYYMCNYTWIFVYFSNVMGALRFLLIYLTSTMFTAPVRFPSGGR